MFNSKLMSVIAVVLFIAIIVVGVLGTHNYYDIVKLTERSVLAEDQLKQLQVSIDTSTSESPKSYTFKDKQGFDDAVFRGINEYIKLKQKVDIDTKLNKYSLAIENGSSQIYGNPSARFTLLEFSDMECPYCKQYQQTPMDIVNDNQLYVNLEFKHFPLSFHNPVAKRQAIASECVYGLVGNKAYWAFIHDVFEQTRGNGAGVMDLAGIAKGVGVKDKEFKACMSSDKALAKVTRDIEEGRGYGINSTPVTVLIDNLTGDKKVINNVQSKQQLLRIISDMAK